MNLQEFAQSIVEDERYRQTVRARAFDGTLPADVELMLLEMADQRWPLPADRPLQSCTLALVRSEAQP